MREEDIVKFNCQQARPLVTSYLDGELSSEQAGPLREHLFDCRGCREVAKEAKVLGRWFVDTEEGPAVPEGFAARVARRAFAGDPGTLQPRDPEPAARGELLPFLLKASALAAGVLLVLAIGIQRRGLPSGDDLRAEPLPPWERAETGLDPRPVPPDEARPAEESRTPDDPAPSSETDEESPPPPR